MSKHTPAPWKVIDANHIDCYRIYALGFTIAETLLHDKESEANAQLIAAAPDLLDTLQCVLECYQDYLDGSVLWDDGLEKVINHAIEQATG